VSRSYTSFPPKCLVACGITLVALLEFRDILRPGYDPSGIPDRKSNSGTVPANPGRLASLGGAYQGDFTDTLRYGHA
jgi:hypothetical protein